jgi:ferredoxin--NADP+ reductase
VYIGRVPAAGPEKLTSTRVTANQEIAPGIFMLSFPREFHFVPGQSVWLTTDKEVPPRLYSIASGTGEPLVEILYDLVPDGLLTPRLAGLREGYTLLVSSAFGPFRDEEGSSCWVAAGTGVAPFASMIRSGLVREKTLIHGSRTIAGLLHRGLFTDALGDRYIPCCSREAAAGVFHGRPTEWLTLQRLPAASRYLLCGGSRMVVDCRDIIIAKGVSFESVIGEIYF